MNKIEQSKRREIKQLRAQLIQSPSAYVETIGKYDDVNLPLDSGHPVRVMRLIYGATDQMPFRALSYAAAALEAADIARVDQLQIVHANQVGNKINGIPIELAMEQTRLFGTTLLNFCRGSFPQFEGRLLHATDTPCETDQFGELARESIEGRPEVAQTLAHKGKARGGDAVRYTAAHFAFQDTDMLELAPLNSGAPDQLSPDTLISIGGISEKPFYEVRMGMRDLGNNALKLATAQIFTKHLLPPYFVARGGEPLISEDFDHVGDPIAARDIAHFLRLYPQVNGENI